MFERIQPNKKPAPSEKTFNLSEKLKEKFKILMMVFSLIPTQALAQEQAEDIFKNDKNKVENIDLKKTTDNNQIERNKKTLKEGEFLVPKNVLIVFAEMTGGTLGNPAGLFINKNFISGREDVFIKKLKELGYSEEKIQDYLKKITTRGFILINEEILSRNDFSETLQHERIHRNIEFLSAEEKKILNEARDYILEDYKKQESIIADYTDQIFLQYQKGEITETEYGILQKKIQEKYPTILNAKSGKNEDLINILNNSEEFWAYLSMETFSEETVSYLKDNFPESYQMYLKVLKDSVVEPVGH